MSIQSTVNSAISSITSFGKASKGATNTGTNTRNNMSSSLEMNNEISKMAMARVEKQRDAMIAQRQILGGNISGGQIT